MWPREIEEVLAAHPAVQEVGVAGVPDEAKGEVVKAWVVMRAGTAATVEELRAFCRQNLAPYKTPAHVEFRDSLPKTMAGKVLRRALVAEHKQTRSELQRYHRTRRSSCPVFVAAISVILVTAWSAYRLSGTTPAVTRFHLNT